MAVRKKLPFAWYEVDAIEAWLDATELYNDSMPDVPSWQQQDILLRSGAHILSAGYSDAEALYPRLNELYEK